MSLPVTTAKQPRPPRILVYGPGGIGKTTLAAAMPGVVVLPVEEGADALDVPRLPQPKSWTETLAMLDLVAADPSGFTALAVDSVTALEAMASAHVAAEHGKASIEAIEYGKGVPALAVAWRGMLDKLTAIRSKGVAIVLIGHSAVVHYDDPRSAGYDRFAPRLHPKAVAPQTMEWCDAVLCAQYRVFTDAEDKGFNRERTRAVGSGERVLYATEKPTHLAKNRYALPDELPMSWAPVFDGIARAFQTTITTTNAATSAA